MRLRSIPTTLLALAVMASGVITAWAHGRPPPAGTVPICRGAYVETVVVDTTGHPVSELRLCPDYYKAFAATGDIGAPVALPVPERVAFTPWQDRAQRAAPAPLSFLNGARAPPSFRP